jgi:hypothetical protein
MARRRSIAPLPRTSTMMMMIGPVWKEPATGLLGATSIGWRDRRATTSRSRGPDVLRQVHLRLPARLGPGAELCPLPFIY